jgi:hypothetical protein
MTMNAKTRTTAVTLLAVVLTLGLFPLERPTSAQSARSFLRSRGNSAQSANSNCHKLKGTRIDVFDPAAGISSGTIINGGWLNGTTETAINFNAGLVFTPDPNVVAFLSDITITTIDGQLKASLVTTFNLATGVFAEWGNINPNSSTGRFAGATGMIFFNGKTIGNSDTGPFESEVVGEICFAS